MEKEVKDRIIKENVLLKLQSGSHLYGLSTPESDVDYLGVVYEPFEYKIGFNTFNELDVSVKDKHSNGRNTKDAIDEKYYSLSRFVELLKSNNPTIVELLFARDVEFRHPVIEKLYEHRMDFLSKSRIENGFIGYAIAQEKKMEIKSENLSEVSTFFEVIKDMDVDGTSTVIDVLKRDKKLAGYCYQYEMNQLDLVERLKASKSKEEIKKLNSKLGKMYLGTREFSVNILFKKLRAQLEQIMNQKSNRSELVEKYNFDVKFASHYLRLLLEGVELLETGEIKFPLKDREFLLDVKLGKYTLDEVLEHGAKLKDRVRKAQENSVISDKVHHGRVEKVVLDFYREMYGVTKG